MKKILILKSSNDDMNVRQTKSCKIFSYYKYNINNFLLRICRKFNLKICSIFFGNWKKELLKYDIVIMFDNGYHEVISSYIKRKNKSIKIILWFWNPIIDYSKKYLLDTNVDEVWSYDKNDCLNYNINYNSQFFNKEIVCPKIKIKKDIVFLGMDKGRKETINDYNLKFKERRLKTQIIIIEKDKDAIDYKEYLKMIGESKAILDIMNDSICGLTLRCMESIFFEKKLITNNKDIVNYDFYNKENIFILGVDDIETIDKFVKTPYKKIDKKIVNNYEFENWLKRFGE